jgi:hypothetical protein
VPARLILGLATPLRDTGDSEAAVKAVSRPERAARAAPVGEVWSEAMGETELGSGSMKGSVAKESWGRVGVEPGGACLA